MTLCDMDAAQMAALHVTREQFEALKTDAAFCPEAWSTKHLIDTRQARIVWTGQARLLELVCQRCGRVTHVPVGDVCDAIEEWVDWSEGEA